MGLLSKIGKSLGKIGESISKAYKEADKKVGGRLPGGVTPAQVKASKPSTPKKTTKTTKTSTPSSSSSSKRTSKRISYGPVPLSDKELLNRVSYADPKTASEIGKELIGRGYNLASSTTGGISAIPRKSPSGSTSPAPMPKDPRTGKPYGTVTAYQRPKGGVLSEGLGLGGISSKLGSKRDILRTEKQRSRTGNIRPIKEAELLGLTALSTVVDFGKGIVDLPETAYRIARNPKVLKELPKAVKQSGKEFGELLRVSPGEAFVKVGGEVLLMKGTGAALNKVSSTSSSQLAKLNPKYVGKAEVGKTLKIKTGKGKTVDLKVVGKIPKETIKSQVSRAGKRLNAISSQADALLKVLKRSKAVKKPIPGEEAFSSATKKLLKQFDAGTISKKNLLKLNEAIKKEGAKGLLERSFFADPTGKVRPSRLGVTKEGKGSLLDYFVEDITFKKEKPQLLLFEDIKVQSFPKSVQKIINKVKKGVSITNKEEAKLLEKYALKKSGMFKGLGFISGESEITLAPGEILKRVKKVGVTIANGKKIPIVKAEVFKPTGKVKDLLTKFRKGKLTKAQTKELDKLLKKETGFNYGLSSAKKTAGKYVDIKKVGAGILSKISPEKPTITTKTISPTYIKPKKKTPKPTKPVSPKEPTPKKPTRKTGKATSKRKAKPKELSKQVSKPKITRKKSKLTPSRSRRKKPTISRKAPVSRLRKRYYGSKKTPSSKSPTRRSPPRSPTSYKSPKSTSKYKPYKSPTSRAGKGATSKTVKKRSSKKTQPTKKKKIGYYVYEKRGKKGFVKLKGLPLTEKQAKDRLAYRLDNKISRTAKLVPVEKVKRFGSLRKEQKGYFNKYKKNLRNYKIVRGKKVKTPLTFIEKKGKGVISTPGEKRQLAINRRAKSSRKVKGYSKPVRKTVKTTPRSSKRKSTQQRKTTRRTTKRSTSKRTRRRNVDPFRYW